MTRKRRPPFLVRLGPVKALTRSRDMGVQLEPEDPTHDSYLGSCRPAR